MSHVSDLQPLIAAKSSALKGTVIVPGDKSISHRSLLLSSQALGRSTISGLLEGEDVLNTAEALRTAGVTIHRQANGTWEVEGVGVGGLAEPVDVIDMGNSGTGVRLLMGLLASYPFVSVFTGDKSLRSRPMARVTNPLAEMGAQFVGRQKGLLPLAVVGSDRLTPIEYTLPVASAQVKSAVILAGLNTAGKTTVIEQERTRDHTERMLQYLGAEIQIEERKDGTTAITLTGRPQLTAKDIVVPGDPSSAAFLVVAALVIPGSDITIENICINPLRTGLYTTLLEMGANIEFLNQRSVAGEEVADLRVKASALKGITVPAERAPSMIDEYPILGVAAAFAEGTTVMEGLAELKVKESNRLAAIEEGLKACGVVVASEGDTLTVKGSRSIPGGGTVKTYMDHRIAMSFLILGLISEKPVTVDDGLMINTSFPGFTTLMNRIGATIKAL